LTFKTFERREQISTFHDSDLLLPLGRKLRFSKGPDTPEMFFGRILPGALVRPVFTAFTTMCDVNG